MLFHKKEYRKPYLKYIISTVKVKYRDIVFISQKLLYQKRITNPESNSYYYKHFSQFFTAQKVLEKGLIPFSCFLSQFNNLF